MNCITPYSGCGASWCWVIKQERCVNNHCYGNQVAYWVLILLKKTKNTLRHHMSSHMEAVHLLKNVQSIPYCRPIRINSILIQHPSNNLFFIFVEFICFSNRILTGEVEKLYFFYLLLFHIYLVPVLFNLFDRNSVGKSDIISI